MCCGFFFIIETGAQITFPSFLSVANSKVMLQALGTGFQWAGEAGTQERGVKLFASVIWTGGWDLGLLVSGEP